MLVDTDEPCKPVVCVRVWELMRALEEFIKLNH